jgi:hypothetical protein
VEERGKQTRFDRALAWHTIVLEKIILFFQDIKIEIFII